MNDKHSSINLADRLRVDGGPSLSNLAKKILAFSEVIGRLIAARPD
jgi:hypothetical protein